MGGNEPFSTLWPQLNESRILNPAKNSPGLCGAYDIVIPTDGTYGFDSESSEQIQANIKRNNINSGTTECSPSRRSKLRRCACKCWPCRESLSRSSLPKDSMSPKLYVPRNRLPAIANDAMLFTQRQMPMPKVSLPNNLASSRRGLLGIHLTPQVPEQVAPGDLADRGRTLPIPQRVSMRGHLDNRKQQDENLSPVADNRSLLVLDPDIRTSSSMLHPRNGQSAREKTLMYSTNRHGSVYTEYKKRNSVVKKPVFKNMNKSYFDTESMRDNYPPARRLPVLPSDLPAHEFVATWLAHGSAPSGESHFPDII